MPRVLKTRTSPTRAHERALWAAGFEVVAGVDEVGRGALAGPVVAAAVILPRHLRLDGVNDSKLLTPAVRRRFARVIKAGAAAVGVGWASHQEVDREGLTAAVALSARRALKSLALAHQAILLDGSHNYLGDELPVKTIIGADGCCTSVAAASIIAKVARDAYMAQMHRLYPEFGFDRHKGYGTAAHLESLKRGASPISAAGARTAVKVAGLRTLLSCSARTSALMRSPWLHYAACPQEQRRRAP